jgi:cyclopropane fatty-acyl-phospholipid synthase-like methyltransferase
MSAEFKAAQCVLDSERSAAFALFCERVYGRNLNQYGTADMRQIDELVELLHLGEGSTVLDIGCGIGTMADYIAGLSGAEVTGIDTSEVLIARARERFRESNRLHFKAMNMDNLEFASGSFDAIISIDSLYFAKDLDGTIGGFCRVLKSSGQMGLFHTQVLSPNDPAERLRPEEGSVGRALVSRGVKFTAHDQTQANLEFWQRSKRVAEELKFAFEEEGNGTLSTGRIAEGNAVIELASAGKFKRYLYHVEHPN